MRTRVLAAWVVVIVSVGSHGCGSGPSQGEREYRARLTARRYALEGFPQWSLANPDKPCPGSLEEIAQTLQLALAKDPWGGSYKMFCGPTLPAGVKSGFLVTSPGPDGKDGTSDDVRSWP